MLIGMEHVAITAALAIFGILGLLITLTAALLRQLPDLFAAWREARAALRHGTRSTESSDQQQT